MRKILPILLCFLLLLTGCKESVTVNSVTEESGPRKIQIGMSFDSFVIERWERDKDVFVSTAKELGAEVNVQNANGDIAKQKEQIEYFIKKGMDAIVIVCIDSDSLAEDISKAKSAGIKVIAYDRLINNADVDLYISFDNTMVGTLMGEAMVKKNPEIQNVIMIGGSPTDNNVAMVDHGFGEVMEQNGINIIDAIHCDGWRAELAADYINQHEDTVSMADAIMCGNDNVAALTIRALAERRMAGDILVVGQDADLNACQRIVEGTQLMTVYKPFEKLAKRAAECTIALASGIKLEGPDVSEVFDGTYDVTYIGLEPLPVTKDNMNDLIIGSGFHLKEDVYLNLPEEMP